MTLKEEQPIFVYWLWRIAMTTLQYIIYIPILILFWGKGKIVPPVKNDLLLESATKLAEKIRSGKLKSEEVVLAYIDRIQEVEPLINAVVEERFHEAVLKAKEVDALIATGVMSEEQLMEEKPLLGVPFTVKMLLTVKGLKCSAGFILFKDRIAEEDAAVVAQMKNAGGIFLALTNAPPFGLSLETHNPLHGKTRNPYDTNRTPGGSSGGESALIAAAGSVIGLGNDLGGSLRIPAHFTGLFSHKPSRGLISNEGTFPSLNPRLTSSMCCGPMCRYAEDLITMMNVLTSKGKDKVFSNQPVNFRNLKIFYQLSNMDPRAEPVNQEIQNAIKKVINYFRENYGVHPTEVNMKLLSISSYLFTYIFNDDLPDLARECTAGAVSDFRGYVELLKYFFGKSLFSLSTILNHMAVKSPLFLSEKDVPQARQLLQKLKEEFEELLDENSVFIYPTSPSAARRHFEMTTLTYNCIYAGIFNLLGLPVTQCPLKLNSSGLPQGVQIVGRHNNDSLTMACAIEISDYFGGWIPPS